MERTLQNDNSGKCHTDYNAYDFPVHIAEGIFSPYPGDKMLAHWHDDIEILQVLDGRMISRVNGCDTELGSGDIIYINSRQIHFNHTVNNGCHYRTVQINPRIFLSAMPKNSAVERFLKDIRIRFYVYFNGSEENREISELIDLIICEYKEKQEFYELDVLSLVCKLFRKICNNYNIPDSVTVSLSDSDLEIQREMITFIYEHFSEKITLEQIAASGHISRSKCCKMFQQYLSQSPISFLTDYRLKESCYMLSETSNPLSQIAQCCGFSEQSYYNRMFRRKYGCTPLTYRKSSKNNVIIKDNSSVSH